MIPRVAGGCGRNPGRPGGQKGARMFSEEQRRAALELYDELGNAKKTVEALGYLSRACLLKWIAGRGEPPAPRKPAVRLPAEDKQAAVARVLGGEPYRDVARDCGVSPCAVLAWRRVGGFARFATASGFAAWMGLVPSEHSSGESRFRGGITKAGNKHLRKLLVEAAWHYKGASRSPKDLSKGQEVDAAARRHANAGVRRLVDRRRALDEAGKQSSVANVAVARELACWCWAVGRMAEGA